MKKNMWLFGLYLIMAIFFNVNVSECVVLPVRYTPQGAYGWCLYASTASIIDYYSIDSSMQLCNLVTLSVDRSYPSNSPHNCCASYPSGDCLETGNIGNSQISGTMIDIINNHYRYPCYEGGALNGYQIDSDITLGMPILATWWFTAGWGHAVLIRGRIGNSNDTSNAMIYFMNPNYGNVYDLQSSFTKTSFKVWNGSMRMSSNSIFNKRPTIDLMINNNQGPVVEVLQGDTVTVTIVDRDNDWSWAGYDIWITCLINDFLYYIRNDGTLTTEQTRYDISFGGNGTINVYSDLTMSVVGKYLITVYKGDYDGGFNTSRAVFDMIDVSVKPPYINIGCNSASGLNNEIEFCGISNGQYTHGKLICTGYWYVNPGAWTASCSTQWDYNQADFYQGCNCN